jgi:hypothetical protein
MERAIGLPISSANESILTQCNEDGGQLVIESHGNGSEETRDASCKRCDDYRTARPGIKVK